MKYILSILLLLLCIYSRSMTAEERHFDLIKRDGPFEIRHYTKVAIAEVLTTGKREEAATAAFRILLNFWLPFLEHHLL